MSDLRVITFDGNNVALYDNGSFVLVSLPTETIIGTVEKCPTSQVQIAKLDTLFRSWKEKYRNFTLLVFFVECKLHQTNCEYELPRGHQMSNERHCSGKIFVVHRSCETELQSPTGGTSGLCFKKLNITTAAYRIIINRLDRKVNAGVCLSFARLLDSPLPLSPIRVGDHKLQKCQTSVLPSLSLRGGHR